MEEQLRNLSKNIANNTGEDHQPKHHEPEEEPPKEEEHHEEHRDDVEEPREEEISDYTPEPESEEHQDDSEKARPETVSRNPHEDFEESEPRDDGSERTGSKDERFGDEATEEPKILTMTEEEEPKESPTRTKKYSPEVEAALNRLNSNDEADFSEPLSTEPKKQSHGASIFLLILFILAIAAATLCVLVERKIIDNPFPNIFNKPESSNVIPSTQEKDDSEPTSGTETNEPSRKPTDANSEQETL